MDTKALNLPLEWHPTFDIIDSSKLTEFMTCPRKFFYRYILGWVEDMPNNHLVFGSAWHAAIEHLLIAGKQGKEAAIVALPEAYNVFDTLYREHFSVETDQDFEPKVPSNAVDALKLFVEQYPWYTRETIYTEISGTVPLSYQHEMHFRIDSVIRENQRVKVQDYKTCSRLTPFWYNQWHLSPQIGLYTHVLYCIEHEHPESVDGAEMIGCCFQRNKPVEIVFYPVRKDPNQMQAWLDNTIKALDALKGEYEALGLDTTEAKIMSSFPLNPTACFHYNRPCPYMHLCQHWPNPLSEASTPPLGFKVERWNPADLDRENTTKMEL